MHDLDLRRVAADDGRRLPLRARSALLIALVAVTGTAGAMSASAADAAGAAPPPVETAEAPPVRLAEDTPPPHARLFWDDGLNYELPRRPSFDEPVGARLRGWLGQPWPPYRLAGKIRLTFQGDGALFQPSGDLPEIGDGIEVRRFVLATSGQLVLGLPIHYSIGFELVQDRFFLNALSVGLRDLPWIGSFRLGQFKPYVTLDSATPSRSLVFMERAAAVQAFAPGEKAGFDFGSEALDRRLTWRLGWFADSTATDGGDATRSPTRVVGRLTWLPVADESSRRLLHLGLSASYIFSPSDAVRYQARPESHLAPKLADTGSIQAENAYVIALESAWVSGPLSLQAEYLQSVVQAVSGPPPLFRGGYLFASWFLTGESRPYDRSRGAFGWLTPRRSVSWSDGGIGAWEVAARFSYLDLDSENVEGGRMILGTLALNWYLTRNLRLGGNYVFGRVTARGGADGGLQIFQGRIQIAF